MTSSNRTPAHADDADLIRAVGMRVVALPSGSEDWTCFRAGSGARCIAPAEDAAPLRHRVARGEMVSLTAAAAELGAAVLCADAPWPLRSTTVAKHWGAEHWYTGMEARGVARIGAQAGAHGASTPLPAALAAWPGACADPPVLAKILAPHAVPGLGDLYFEQHAHKHEVYLVLDVDASAWPDGRGRVRLGLQDAGGISATRDAFRAAVERYRDARNDLDAWLTDARAARGLAPDACLDPRAAETLLQAAPQDLRSAEVAARDRLAERVRTRAIAPGDVVDVPAGTAHGLLHGVRVLEFQTPVFERSILYAHQRVTTQAHWDLDAIDALSVAAAPAPDAETMTDRDGARLARIARCAGFDLYRLELAEGMRLHPPPGNHGVLICVQGRLRCGTLSLAAEDAALLPGAALAALAEGAGGPGIQGCSARAVCVLAVAP